MSKTAEPAKAVTVLALSIGGIIGFALFVMAALFMVSLCLFILAGCIAQRLISAPVRWWHSRDIRAIHRAATKARKEAELQNLHATAVRIFKESEENETYH